MKYITPEQFNLITKKSITDRFYKATLSLEIGEGIFIEKNEWTRKTSPAIMVGTIRGLKSDEGKKFSTRSNSKGWGIMRTA